MSYIELIKKTWEIHQIESAKNQREIRGEGDLWSLVVRYGGPGVWDGKDGFLGGRRGVEINYEKL